MQYVIVAALVFGLCFLVDKGFTKLFRSKPQHSSGQSVRLSKYYGVGGLLMIVLGTAALFASGGDGLLLFGGCVILPVGIGLCIYYLSFGIYYDEESFLVSGMFKKSITYRYADIQGQLLYKSAGNVIIVELHMHNGKAVQVLSNMTGADAFLSKAFDRWLEQTGKQKEDCTFHDPDNSCWFPTVEG